MIETLNLTKTYGPIQAVDDLSFTVDRGEVLGFLGPNGAGKSTTMKMLTCFVRPTSGTAKIFGHDILEEPMAVRRMIGYLPEGAPAYGEMPVQAFLTFVGRIRGLSGRELDDAVESVMDTCSLQSTRHQLFETLSKGFKRRVCLAQALIHDPPVLIMDEPTDGLDPNQKREVRRLISRMAKDKIIILSTHILEEVDAVCSRVVIISRGSLVANETPDRLRQRAPNHGAVSISVRTSEGGSVREALEGLAQVAKVETEDEAENKLRRFRVFPKKGKSISGEVARLAREKNWEIEGLHVEKGRLDDVFRELTEPGGESSRS